MVFRHLFIIRISMHNWTNFDEKIKNGYQNALYLL